MIYKESYIKNNAISLDKKSNIFVIKDDYYELLLKIISDFMDDYNLGKVSSFMSKYNHDGVVDYLKTSASIDFNTTVANAMYAYYMEKQRIKNFLPLKKDNNKTI